MEPMAKRPIRLKGKGYKERAVFMLIIPGVRCPPDWLVAN